MTPPNYKPRTSNKKYIIKGNLKEYYDSITDDEHTYDYVVEVRNEIGAIEEDANNYEITIDQVMYALECAMKKLKE